MIYVIRYSILSYLNTGSCNVSVEKKLVQEFNFLYEYTCYIHLLPKIIVLDQSHIEQPS